MPISIDKKVQNSPNLVDMLDDSELMAIGEQVVRDYEIDEDSRSEWKETIKEAMLIAKQVMEEKSFPWPGASNIKMPIIAKASIEYASRTLPEIIQNELVVKGVVVGKDPTGEKQLRANRVAAYMSYQLVNKSPDWEDGMDSLIQTLPVLGTVFKKTYYSITEKRVISEMCVPDKIVVNYDTQSLVTARRITHILQLYKNDVVERQRRGIYRDDIDAESLTPKDYADTRDDDNSFNILEQHCYLDLDDDGYREPYIVTVHKESRTVLRVVARFKNIERSGDKIVAIEPEHFFTDYHFIKSPDGGFYSMGFGSLLLPINKTINTLVNLLIDAGVLSNTQGGVIARQLRIKNGEFRIKMGEWKTIDMPSGSKIADSIYPLPVREPSTTLFQLLGLMLQEAKDLSSTTDVMLGKQPAQNVASGTISQLVEQGTKIFAAINKRVYRSLKKEYKKVYDLNYRYLSQKDYQYVLDDELADVKKDFEPESCDIHPIADPTLSTDQQRIMKASIIGQLATVDRRAADEMVLNAMQIDEATKKKLLPEPDPEAPPPPEVQKLMAEIQQIQANIGKISADATLSAEKVGIERARLQKDLEFIDAQVHYYAAMAWKIPQDVLHNQRKDQITTGKATSEQQIKQANAMHNMQKDNHASMVDEAKIAHADSQLQVDALLKAKELEIKQKQADKKPENGNSGEDN